MSHKIRFPPRLTITLTSFCLGYYWQICQLCFLHLEWNNYLSKAILLLTWFLLADISVVFFWNNHLSRAILLLTWLLLADIPVVFFIFVREHSLEQGNPRLLLYILVVFFFIIRMEHMEHSIEQGKTPSGQQISIMLCSLIFLHFTEHMQHSIEQGKTLSD